MDRGKYVIEVPDDTRRIWIDVFGDGHCYTIAKEADQLEKLNSDYINEHFGELQDEAYQKGINDGSLDVKLRVKGSYQRGLEDAWEAARKIIHMPEGDLLNIFTECYSAVCTALQVLLKYDASEAIAKLKAYEDKQKDHIEVGDEVRTRDGAPSHTFLVTKATDSHVYGISDDGSWNYWTKDEVTKTGKHYDIQSILEAMRQ